MTTGAKVAPQNSLLLVMDKDGGEIPDSMNSLVAATPSCIAVGTMSAADGETSVTLSDDGLPIQGIENLKKVFSGILATPRMVVEVCTVLLEPVLTLPVHNNQSDVEIWANSEIEPDRIFILIL